MSVRISVFQFFSFSVFQFFCFSVFQLYITLICAVPGGNSAPVKVDIRELAYIEKQKN